MNAWKKITEKMKPGQVIELAFRDGGEGMAQVVAYSVGGSNGLMLRSLTDGACVDPARVDEWRESGAITDVAAGEWQSCTFSNLLDIVSANLTGARGQAGSSLIGIRARWSPKQFGLPPSRGNYLLIASMALAEAMRRDAAACQEREEEA